MGVSAIATGVWTAAQWLLNASFYGFPLVWIIVAIAAVIAAVWLIVANWDTISKWLGAAWDWLAKKAHDIFFAVWHTIVDAWQTALNWTRNLMQAISDWVHARIDDVLTRVRLVLAVAGIFLDAFRRARDAVIERAGELLAFVGSIPGKIWGFLSGLAGSLYNLGRDMIQGLLNGIRSLGGKIKDTLLGLLPGPLRAFAGALGITSPSKVFARYGMETIRGYIVGVRGQQAGVTAAVASVVPQVASTRFDVEAAIGRLFTPATGPGGAGGGAGFGGTGRLEELLQNAIDAIERVAPGVGKQIGGAVSNSFQLSRAR